MTVETHVAKRGTDDYWIETGRLLLEYLELRLPPGRKRDAVTLCNFSNWLETKPGYAALYEGSDDMRRAWLVDDYLAEKGLL